MRRGSSIRNNAGEDAPSSTLSARSSKRGPSTEDREHPKLTTKDSMPGVTVRKVTSMNDLPETPNQVKVRIHKTKELSALLPRSLKDLRLVFLSPRQVKVRTLIGRVQTMLKLELRPALRLWPETERGGLATTHRPRRAARRNGNRWRVL